jgi:hypothetical protein
LRGAAKTIRVTPLVVLDDFGVIPLSFFSGVGFSDELSCPSGALNFDVMVEVILVFRELL